VTVIECGIGKDLEGSRHGAMAGRAVRLTLGTGENCADVLIVDLRGENLNRDLSYTKRKCCTLDRIVRILGK